MRLTTSRGIIHDMQPTLTTLKNGLRVLFVDTHAFPTLTTLLLIGAGSRYETEENNGIAHFFEHMPYKGSKKYPSSFIISSTIEGMGGAFNAFTAKDHTGYWVKGTANHFPQIIDILSDILLHPLLDPTEIEKEKGVIVEEINMYEDTPTDRVGEIFETLMYPKSPLGYDIVGSKETVTSFTRDTFTSYMERFYHPKNVVLVVAGGFQKDAQREYLKLIEEKFGDWNGQASATFDKVSENQSKPALLMRKKPTEQAHFCLGYRAFSFFDERKHALNVLSTILGGGMSSRLFMEVREKHGLCYYISTGRQLYHDVGNIVTQAGVVNDVEKMKKAIELTIAEHETLKHELVPEDELIRAKESIKGRLLLSLEKSENVAGFFGQELILRDVVESVEQSMADIDAVTASAIKTLSQELFIPKNLNISLISPFDESIDLESVVGA